MAGRTIESMSDTSIEDGALDANGTTGEPEAGEPKSGKGRSAADIAAHVSQATGWNVTAYGEMSLVATKAGLAPITVHCSSAQEAAEIMLRTLLDDGFQPLAATKASQTVEETPDSAS